MGGSFAKNHATGRLRIRQGVRPRVRAQALAYCEALRSAPNDAAALAPGARYWEIFTRLCSEVGARGNLIPDAYLAALAIETGSEWITTDGDYRRFPGLRVRHPLGEEV